MSRGRVRRCQGVGWLLSCCKQDHLREEQGRLFVQDRLVGTTKTIKLAKPGMPKLRVPDISVGVCPTTALRQRCLWLLFTRSLPRRVSPSSV